MMIMSILIGALSIATKELVQGLEDWEIMRRMETIQTSTSLRSVGILRRVVET